ncbi:MAG: ABC transporter ATP-binding protein [Deinococcales bacterium]
MADGSRLEVLRGLELTLHPTQVVAILGPSGSGKSTLLHLLAGLDNPTSGEIYWGETAIHQLKQNRIAALRASALGLIFQHHYLLEDINVLDNVSLSGRIQGNIDPQRALEILAAVGLEKRGKSMPEELSGGERQRVAVARALYHKPPIILADEPTGSLDRKNAQKVYELLVNLAKEQGSAVVMVTHDEGLVKEVDARYHLEDGILR